MKFALSTLFAFALLAGPSGCCLFPCAPALDGCGMNGCGHNGCGGCGCEAQGYPASGCGGCGGMGCSRRLHIFNWSRCHDCCDQCGHWTGEGFVSQKGGWPGRGYPAAPANFDEPVPEPLPEPAPETEMMTPDDPAAGTIVPGSMRVTTRDVEPAPMASAEDPLVVKRPRTISASPRPAKRISSSKK